MNSHYYVTKEGLNNNILGNLSMDGFDVTPKNNINYGGIAVNKLVIIKQAFIERILKKKIKRKLELYLQFLIDFIDNDSDDGETLREVLNDVTRYKQIVDYRYRKHLGEKYIDLLLKKIEMLEYELKVKIYTIDEKHKSLGDEAVSSKSR